VKFAGEAARQLALLLRLPTSAEQLLVLTRSKIHIYTMRHRLALVRVLLFGSVLLTQAAQQVSCMHVAESLTCNLMVYKLI
jgi:hypothetical protein